MSEVFEKLSDDQKHIAEGWNRQYDEILKLRRTIQQLVSLIRIKTSWNEDDIRGYIKASGGSWEEI